MALKLPPKATCKPSDAAEVERLLASVIAGSPGATKNYQFYEEVDAWLGPWGASGYPMGYGKKYNLLFEGDADLNSFTRPVTRDWVKWTTIYLQRLLLDWIVARVKDGTIGGVTEPQLRAAAFNSHPKAYLDAGLRRVATDEIESLGTIILIPYEQFNPSSPNFGATFKQIVAVVEDGGGVCAWLGMLLEGGVYYPAKKVASLLGMDQWERELRQMYGNPAFFY